MSAPSVIEPLVIEAVLHPTDFSDTDYGAIVHALRIALSAKGRLSYLHVGPKGSDVRWRDFPHTRKILAAWGVLPEEADHDAVLNIGLSVRKSLRKGVDVGAEIGGEIRKAGADVVVLATRQRRGLFRRFRKAKAMEISRRLDRPVLLVPRGDEVGFVDLDTGTVRLEHIVVPSSPELDPTDCLEAALGLGLVVAPGPVTVHVVQLGEAEDQPRYTLPKLREGWKVEAAPVGGAGLVGALLEAVDEVAADLIVMPNFLVSGVREKLFGTPTEQVVRAAGCPVLVVPE